MQGTSAHLHDHLPSTFWYKCRDSLTGTDKDTFTCSKLAPNNCSITSFLFPFFFFLSFSHFFFFSLSHAYLTASVTSQWLVPGRPYVTVPHHLEIQRTEERRKKHGARSMERQEKEKKSPPITRWYYYCRAREYRMDIAKHQPSIDI